MSIDCIVKFDLFRRRNKSRFQLPKRQNKKTVVSKRLLNKYSGRIAQGGG